MKAMRRPKHALPRARGARHCRRQHRRQQGQRRPRRRLCSAASPASAPYASYLTVNISSPNTPGLRNLQAREQLGELLSRVMAARAAGSRRKPPVFLKIAPDLVEAELDDIAAEVARETDRRPHRLQHHAFRAPALRSGDAARGDRRAFRQAAVRTLDHRAGAGCASCSARHCRSSASAASTPPKRRWRRSAPAPISSSSTPA